MKTTSLFGRLHLLTEGVCASPHLSLLTERRPGMKPSPYEPHHDHGRGHLSSGRVASLGDRRFDVGSAFACPDQDSTAQDDDLVLCACADALMREFVSAMLLNGISFALSAHDNPSANCKPVAGSLIAISAFPNASTLRSTPMRHSSHTFLALAAAAALALSLTATAHAQSQAASTPASKMASASGAGMGMGLGKGDAHGSDQMHRSMMSGMDGMKTMKLTGNTDMDFAMMMKMHHEQALEMAKAEIAHGKSAELKALSRKIIAAQQKEIAQLDKWMAANK